MNKVEIDGSRPRKHMHVQKYPTEEITPAGKGKGILFNVVPPSHN